MIRFHRAVSVSVVCLAISACAPVQDAQETAQIQVTQDVQSSPAFMLEALADNYAETRGFNGTVLVARGDEILLEKSYGEAVIEWDVPVATDTRFRIGSLSKPFVATLVMSLVEDGTLSLDDTLGQHLPDIYGDTPVADVTVAELLSHTSGMGDLPRDLNGPWYKTTARHEFEPERLVKEWIKPEFTTERGQWRYNNAGFIVLGLIVETATQRPYNEVLDEKILTPAGMTSTAMFTNDAIVENLARPYIKSTNDDLRPAPFLDPSVLFTAAGLYSTARDIYRFDQALYTDEILSDASQASMFSAKTDFPYGYGWGIESWTLKDGTVLPGSSHTGSIPGYQSFYLRSEPNRDFVIVLNNTNNGSATYNLGQELMKLLNGEVIKKRLEDLLLPVIETDGVDAMIATYRALGDDKNDYDLSEQYMNRFGYKLLRMEKTDAAIVVFEWNVEAHPDSANPRDSLGEAYRSVGRIEEAIASYEAALEREPDSPSAQAALEEMRAD